MDLNWTMQEPEQKSSRLKIVLVKNDKNAKMPLAQIKKYWK